MSVEIGESDYLSRCIIYDRFFSGNIHVDKLLFQFGPAKEDGACHESLVLRSLAPTDEEVHMIGCKIASDQNARKGNPPPGPNRKYYCGFRTANVASIVCEGDGYQIELRNVEENGEPSHVDLALRITVDGKSARNTRRLAAGLSLAEAFGPPTPFVCSNDHGDAEHPFEKWGPKCLSDGFQDRWPGIVIELPLARA
jgi:hypothetical protein